MYAIIVEPYFFQGTLGVIAEKHLYRDEQNEIVVFDTKEEAEQFIDKLKGELESDSPYILQHGEYAPPDYDILDLDEYTPPSFTAGKDDDFYCNDPTWKPFADAVAYQLRHSELTFPMVEGEESLSDETAFGLRISISAPQLAMDVAEAEGQEWWWHLDYEDVDKMAVRGEFEAPVDLQELADLLNWLDKDAIEHGGVKLDDLPTFGGEEPTDTLGVFSWDEDSLLVQDNATGKWIVTERAEHEKTAEHLFWSGPGATR